MFSSSNSYAAISHRRLGFHLLWWRDCFKSSAWLFSAHVILLWSFENSSYSGSWELHICWVLLNYDPETFHFLPKSPEGGAVAASLWLEDMRESAVSDFLLVILECRAGGGDAGIWEQTLILGSSSTLRFAVLSLRSQGVTVLRFWES